MHKYANFLRNFNQQEEFDMSRKTTSDEIKTVLGGDEKDWKRLSKKKNEDGQWVREFENKKTGAQVEVIEMSEGKFLARPVEAAGSLTEEANGCFVKPDEVTEEDIDMLLSDGFIPGMPEAQSDRLLAGLHCFAIANEHGYMMAMITPISYYEQTGYCYDQSTAVGSILDKCAEAMEAAYEFTDPAIKTPADAAKYLSGLGIQWRKDFQDFVDSSITKELEAWAQQSAAKGAAKPSGNTPKI